MGRSRKGIRARCRKLNDLCNSRFSCLHVLANACFSRISGVNYRPGASVNGADPFKARTATTRCDSTCLLDVFSFFVIMPDFRVFLTAKGRPTNNSFV